MDEELEEGRALDVALAQPDGPVLAGPAAAAAVPEVKQQLHAAAKAGDGGRVPPGPAPAVEMTDSVEEAGAAAQRKG